jgi:hypothetical protein
MFPMLMRSPESSIQSSSMHFVRSLENLSVHLTHRSPRRISHNLTPRIGESIGTIELRCCRYPRMKYRKRPQLSMLKILPLQPSNIMRTGGFPLTDIPS